MRQVVWPFIAVIGVSMALVVIILSLPYMSSAGFLDSQTSNAINSARTAINDLFPWFMVLVTAGIIGMALTVGRKR